jgi:hypothetical protein
MPRHADEPFAELHPCAEEFAAADDFIDLGACDSLVAEFARKVRAEFSADSGGDEDLGGSLVALGSVAVHRLVDYEGVRVPCGLVDRFSEFVEEWAHHAHISVIRMPAQGARVRFRIVAFGVGLTRFEFELAARDDGIPGQVVTLAREI